MPRRLPSFARRLATGLVALVAAGVTAAGASLVHTELLRISFQRQVWVQARFAGAELLGAGERFGRIVESTKSSGHCDFAAVGVYGVDAEFEPVEASYATRTVSVGGEAPVAFSVTPVSDTALSGAVPRPGSTDERVRDALEQTHVDLARARSFRTVYVVEAISWGHAPWLDWRCR